ncbi:T6SS immunity protein Tli4 family protein [Thiomonas sp.]|uniref:T6SS immunity protein Tli4 family protein n=1 Tax=Thiomonas sp. TaxID=2047785 RepID=UPI002615B7ED|nr:T6SS immunity protein Tli4 family protein [Thiomonas sp.]
MDDFRRRLLSGGGAGAAASILNACAGPLNMISTTKVPAPRLDDLYARTKLMCFGRYAVELPAETEQIMGPQEIAGGFKLFSRKDFMNPQQILESQWKKERSQLFREPEMITGIENGPVQNAMHFWYYRYEHAKREDRRWLDGAIAIDSRLYLYEGMTAKSVNLSADELFQRMSALMRGMRAWDGKSVPREPGVCIEGAFIHEPTYRFQEIMSSGFAFPSMPDVHFSVMSNKDASTQDENGIGLLESVRLAQRDAGVLGLLGGYPYTFLRRGKRTLHGLWEGEEVLSRSTRDQALRFEWQLVGQTGNVARPAHLDISLSTRVENNRVGAARTSAITDEQAVALWDRLLEGVKFRVAVPGATAASVALG